MKAYLGLLYFVQREMMRFRKDLEEKRGLNLIAEGWTSDKVGRVLSMLPHYCQILTSGYNPSEPYVLPKGR
jgi:hypothetical protein